MRGMLLKRWARLAGALAFSLAACTPTAATQTATAPVTAPPILPSTLLPPTATAAPIIVTVWLPPYLAPDIATPAGALLAERLESFEAAQPGVKLAVRTKETSGPSGLLETLRAASVVAPASLPDVIALGPGELSAAAEGQLIIPYPAPLPQPEESDWFEFALRSASVGDVRYGVPSAGQTDVLVYQVGAYGRSPSDWSAVVGGAAPFIFPAADPQAAFTLAEYLSAGGQLTQAQGSPAIDPGVLEEILTFYGSAYSAGVLPLTTRQYESSGTTAELFEQGRAASAVAPLEGWLLAPRPGSSAAPLPTRDGGGVALARTWSWSLVTEEADLQTIAVDLVEWLSDPEFLGPWTHALGSLPPNAAALEKWPSGTAATLVNQIVRVAQPMPPRGVTDIVGPALRKAVDAVLSGALTPQTAALQASTEVAGP
jgi:ABC-type glycerol-3-phosphate transport system substrate-binding protein